MAPPRPQTPSLLKRMRSASSNLRLLPRSRPNSMVQPSSLGAGLSAQPLSTPLLPANCHSSDIPLTLEMAQLRIQDLRDALSDHRLSTTIAEGNAARAMQTSMRLKDDKAALMTECSRLQAKVEKLESSNRRLERKNERLEEEAELGPTAMAALERAQEAEEEMRRARADATHADQARTRSGRENAKRVEQLEEELETLREKYRHLKDKLSKSHNSPDKEELESVEVKEVLTAWTAERANFNARLHEQEALRRRSSSLIQALRGEVKGLKEALGEKRCQVVGLEKEVARLRAECEVGGEELERLERIEAQYRRCTGYEAENRALRGENERLRKSLSVALGREIESAKGSVRSKSASPRSLGFGHSVITISSQLGAAAIGSGTTVANTTAGAGSQASSTFAPRQ